MAALNFPTSPNVGDTHTANGGTWKWNGVAWRAVPSASSGGWVRNAAWLELPDVTGQQKFVGLYAIFPEANYIALSATGDYTIDWGDGTSENIASGVTAERNIAWADVSATTEVGLSTAQAVTFTDAGDTVNLTAHGWSNGQKVAFSSITSTTGISTYTTYYIVNKAADTFQVASTIGGSALTLTTNGSGMVYVPQYRQVIITITPNGGNLTNISQSSRHSAVGSNGFTSNVLDIAIAGSALTSLSFLFGTTMLECFRLVGSTSITSFDSLLLGGKRLEHVEIHIPATATTCYSMFSGCQALKNCILTCDATMSLLTNVSTMFYQCYSLKNVEIAYNLTSAATNCSLMFSNCYSLTSVSLFNTAVVTDFSQTFSNCYSLTNVPLFNTASGTNFSSMFNSCYSLTSVPLFNTASGTNFSSMFNGCYSLTNVPLFNTASGTNFFTMFYYCQSLRSIPAINVNGATSGNLNNIADYCYAAQSIDIVNIRLSTQMIRTNLSGAALNRLYTQLVNVGSARTLTVTGSAGLLFDTPSIATAKNWTVVG